MQKKHLLLLSTLLISLSSCGIFNSTSTSGDTVTHTDSDENNSTISQSSTSLDDKDPGSGEIDIYCINDFHGRVMKQTDEYAGGISRLSTYLNNKKASNPDGTIFLNAGDLWQDTYDSGQNRGELLTKASVEIGFEAMALGNHEFDWGVETIKHNKAIAESSENATQFTFLGCNIYNYDNTTNKATTQASDIASPYKVIERGDIRIGIIGAIGENQITSITSSNWTNLTFLNPVSIVKETSDYLRSEQDCDVIIYMLHANLKSSSYATLSAVSPNTNKPYVDAAFLGHSHAYETAYSNGVPWIQSKSHGVAVGHVKLSVSNGSVTCEEYTDYKNNGYQSAGVGSGADSIYACSPDEKIETIINKYITYDFVSMKNEKIGKLTNYNYSSIGSDIGRIQAYATSKYIDKLRSYGADIPSIDIVLNNGNRDEVSLDSECSLSREEIFNLTPFTNKTIVAKVLGQDIINEAINYSNPYYLPGEAALTINADEYYTVACIDYLLLHKNKYRAYDYFSSYSDSLYVVNDYPYEIIWDYFVKNKTFDMSTMSNVCYTGLSK